MTVDLESFAEEAARAEIAPAPPQLRPCIFCAARGIEASKWSWLWGRNCWVCGGWGVVEEGLLHLRGPFARHPSRRHSTQ